MATIRLIPSTYSLSNSSYLNVSNPSNMYANVDSTNYATLNNTQTGTSSYYLYLKGFNFSDVPSNVVINSFTVKVKLYQQSCSTSTTYGPIAVNNTTSLASSTQGMTTSAKTYTLSVGSASFQTIKGYGNNFGVRICNRRSNRNTASYVYIYGAEILIDYTEISSYDITTSCNTGGTISPNGKTTVQSIDTFQLTITPQDAFTNFTIKDNNVDVTDSAVIKPKQAEVSSYPKAYTTSGSISGTYYQQAIGKGTSAASVSGNNYASSSGQTAYISYTFDLSAVPSDAQIIEVKCAVKGHIQSTSQSTRRAGCQLYAGTTAKGSETGFTSTSDAIINLNCGTWTRSEINNLSLRFTIGYYGGNVSGAQVTVVYGIPGDNNIYIYTINPINENHTVIVTFTAGTGPVLYLKVNGTWTAVTSVYQKVNGTWVLQTDLTSLFAKYSNNSLEFAKG